MWNNIKILFRIGIFCDKWIVMYYGVFRKESEIIVEL